MARLAAIIALAVSCAAWGAPLPISTGTIVPRQMKWEVKTAQSNRACPIAFYIGNVVTAYTAICWIRFPPTADSMMSACPFPACTTYPARATFDGGKQSDFPTPIYGYSQITLDANGQWVMPVELPAATDPHYAAAGAAWVNGCYSVNIFTPCAVTLTVGGAERNFSASNTMQRAEIQAANSSRSVALSAADPSAVIYFGIRENIPRQFHQNSFGQLYGTDIKSITNEWVMIASSAYIDAEQKVVMDAFCMDWDGVQMSNHNEHTQTVPRSTFAVNSTMRFNCCGTACMTGGEYELYGWKLFIGALSEAQIERICDLDKAEMQRRGMARFRSQ